MRFWTFALGYLALYGLAGWSLGGHPYARFVLGTVGVAVPAVALVVVVLLRRRRWSGCQRLFWNVVAIGAALWLAGLAGWRYDAMAPSEAARLSWFTLFTLCGAIAPLVALFARPHRGVRAGSLPELGFDMAGYGLLALFIYTYFGLIPSLVGESDSPTTLFALLQANRLLQLGGVVAFAWTARRTPWRDTYLRLGAGVALVFLPSIAAGFAIAGTTHPAGFLRDPGWSDAYPAGTLYDLAWIGLWICYAWAAAESPPAQGEPARVDVPSRPLPAVFGAIPVFAVPLIGYSWLKGDSIGTVGDAFRGLLTSVVTVAGLGLVTLRLASQSGELQRADSRLKLLAAATEQTRDLILITRADSTIEHGNDAFLRAVGYSRAELSSMRFSDLLALDSDFNQQDANAVVRQHGVWRGTVRHRRRDGSTFPASCTVIALKDAAESVTHYVGVERDVTEDLTLGDQRVQAERLAAMAELVAGVAHEINNPLQTVIGAAELMLEETPAGAGDDPQSQSRRRDLELVRREAGRAGQIVRNLLAFIRKSAPDRAPADLNEIVRVTVDLRRYRLEQRTITPLLRCDPSPLPVLVNREEIQQIILNLLLNAEQALGSDERAAGPSRGGTITVLTGRCADSVFAEVADDGPGISPELRGRVFEPFFTTKEVGQGTGLGLSLSHGIASAHGGSLALRPSAAGACFRLTLPLASSSS